MMKRSLIISGLVAVLSLSAGLALAADQQELIYGSQLMTQQERNEYRAQMRAAKTAEERERIRNEHHERMRERAEAQGLTLPDMPPARGEGMWPDDGMGPGSGMGPGGMGPEGGRGR